jgi:hypothetical protein
MDRRKSALIFFSLVSSIAVSAWAATPPPPSPSSGSVPSEAGSPKPTPATPLPTKTPADPEFEHVRKALNALTPEQFQRFHQNFLRWSNLSPEEKKMLRDRETMQRQKMLAEAQNALTKTGLQLSEDQKALFFKRYGEERRKIEESLRAEMDHQRKPRVEALILGLKSEFSLPGPDTP